MFDLIQHLKRKFPNSMPAQKHFGELLTAYQASGLAPPHFWQEIATGDEQKLRACIWESMLYSHFRKLGFEFRHDQVHGSGQNGPDIGLIHEGQTIWVEAVVPKPEGLSSAWLDPPKRGKVEVKDFPHEEMLLRWTSVLRDKNLQLKRRLQCGVVKPSDPYVVAINSCMLSYCPAEDHGITQFPFAVEAVFPIGPIALSLTKAGKFTGSAVNTLRYSIRKPKGVQVPTDNFLNPEYSGISALIGCSRRDMLNDDLHLTMVHNPLASVCLATGLLGAEAEYVAQDDGASAYLLTTV